MALTPVACGGADGNEILTNAVAVVLVGLLVAEWITVAHMQGLRSAHMFIGLVLIPPVALKLGSTGYRMIRYYGGSPAYRAKGPPLLPLRLMAPVFAASTIAVFASGVAVPGVEGSIPSPGRVCWHQLFGQFSLIGDSTVPCEPIVAPECGARVSLGASDSQFSCWRPCSRSSA